MDNTTDSKKTNKVIIILRWITVLPAAVGGFLVGGIIINIFDALNRWFMGVGEGSGWEKIMYYIVSSIAASVLSVYWGARVAPTGRRIIAMVIAALIIIVATFSVIISIGYNYPDMWWIIASAISSIIAAGYMVHGFYTEGDDFSLFD